MYFPTDFPKRFFKSINYPLKSFEKLAIHGGSKLRNEPFGPRWVFGQEEKDKLIEVIDEVIEFDFDNFKFIFSMLLLLRLFDYHQPHNSDYYQS